MELPVPNFDGVSGWIAARVMTRKNAEAEAEAVARLAPAPGARILAIGFGPGVGLAALLNRPVGHVVGVDPSAVMHRVAGDRNREALARGRLTLVRDLVENLDPALGGFDGAIAVHTLQMCRPFAPTAARLAAVLNPGARLVAITHGWAAARDHGSEEAFLTGVRDGLQAAGFPQVTQGRADCEGGKALLIEARR